MLYRQYIGIVLVCQCCVLNAASDPAVKVRKVVDELNKSVDYSVPIEIAEEAGGYDNLSVPELIKKLDSWNNAVRWRVAQQISYRPVKDTIDGVIAACNAGSPNLRAGAERALEEILNNVNEPSNREYWKAEGPGHMTNAVQIVLGLLKDKERAPRIGAAGFFEKFFRSGIGVMEDQDGWRGKIGDALLEQGVKEKDQRVCVAIINALNSHAVIEKCNPETRDKLLAQLLLAQPFPDGRGNAARMAVKLINEHNADINIYKAALIKMAETPTNRNMMYLPGGRQYVIKLMVEKKQWEILPAIGIIIIEPFVMRDPAGFWGNRNCEDIWKAIDMLEKEQVKVIAPSLKKVVARVDELSAAIREKANGGNWGKDQLEKNEAFKERLLKALNKVS